MNEARAIARCEEAAALLPPRFRRAALQMPDHRKRYTEEFRLRAGQPQRQLSKEFVRQWLIEHGFMGKAGQQVPEMTPEFCASVSERYIELYEHVTGRRFEPADETHLADRIADNVVTCLNQLQK